MLVRIRILVDGSHRDLSLVEWRTPKLESFVPRSLLVNLKRRIVVFDDRSPQAIRSSP